MIFFKRFAAGRSRLSYHPWVINWKVRVTGKNTLPTSSTIITETGRMGRKIQTINKVKERHGNKWDPHREMWLTLHKWISRHFFFADFLTTFFFLANTFFLFFIVAFRKIGRKWVGRLFCRLFFFADLFTCVILSYQKKSMRIQTCDLRLTQPSTTTDLRKIGRKWVGRLFFRLFFLPTYSLV